MWVDTLGMHAKAPGGFAGHDRDVHDRPEQRSHRRTPPSGAAMSAPATGKRAAAAAALAYITSETVIGVGTGTTVACFIDALGEGGTSVTSAVATSVDTERRLRRIGITPLPLEAADKPIAIYVDGADEIDRFGRAIKGGGGAHTREKRVAESSTTWVCIVDESKVVEHLGTRRPVPLEVVRTELDGVIAHVRALGGTPAIRAGSPELEGNRLVDVHDLDLTDPLRMEEILESIPGVIACGIFARRRADVILVGREDDSVLTLAPDDVTSSGRS